MLLCTEFYFKAPSALTSRDESVSVLILICGITVWSFFSHSLLTYEMFLFTKTLKKRQLRSEVQSLDQVRNAVICFFWKVKSRHMERLCSRSSSLIYVLHFWPFPGVIDTTASGRLQVARSTIWASRIWYLFTQAAVARLNTSTQANKHVSRDEPDMCNKI